MRAKASRRRATTIKVLVITPLIVAALVISGTYFGLYLGELIGFSKAILAATMGTLGLFISLPIVVRVVDRMVRRDTMPETEAQ